MKKNPFHVLQAEDQIQLKADTLSDENELESKTMGFIRKMETPNFTGLGDSLKVINLDKRSKEADIHGLVDEDYDEGG